MDGETFGAYEIADICNAYSKQTNDWDEIERNLPQGRYVRMDALFNKNCKNNPTQKLVTVDSTGDNKFVGKSAIRKKMQKEEPMKKINRSGKIGAFGVHLAVSRKAQFGLLMDELKQIFSQQSITDKTRNIKPQALQKDYGEIYCVPNNQPAFPTEIHNKKEFTFRSRSNACVSKNKKLYLKETKFTDTLFDINKLRREK